MKGKLNGEEDSLAMHSLHSIARQPTFKKRCQCCLIGKKKRTCLVGQSRVLPIKESSKLSWPPICSKIDKVFHVFACSPPGAFNEPLSKISNIA